MLTVLLVLQVIVTVSMIVVILIQRSASDGMAGLAGGGNSLMSGRASANLLTRITSILAVVFIVNSLIMAAMTSRSSKSETSVIDKIKIEEKAPAAPVADAPLKQDNLPVGDKTGGKAPAAQEKESAPVVPIAE